jgi:hypothetical protein
MKFSTEVPVCHHNTSSCSKEKINSLLFKKKKKSHSPAWFQYQDSNLPPILFYLGYQAATSEPLLDKTTNCNHIGYTQSSLQNLSRLEQMQQITAT